MPHGLLDAAAHPSSRPLVADRVKTRHFLLVSLGHQLREASMTWAVSNAPKSRMSFAP